MDKCNDPSVMGGMLYVHWCGCKPAIGASRLHIVIEFDELDKVEDRIR